MTTDRKSKVGIATDDTNTTHSGNQALYCRCLVQQPEATERGRPIAIGYHQYEYQRRRQASLEPRTAVAKPTNGA